MFKRILYPTDFSEVSKKALDYIKQLKEGGAKEVIVLHVIDEREIESIHRASAYVSYEKEVDKVIKKNAKEQTRLIKAELKESGFDVKIRIEKGIPFRDILRVEKEEAVSVIVVGSHGKSNIEEMFLGSVSEKVIRKCKKPVLVIKR